MKIIETIELFMTVYEFFAIEYFLYDCGFGTFGWYSLDSTKHETRNTISSTCTV